MDIFPFTPPNYSDHHPHGSVRNIVQGKVLTPPPTVSGLLYTQRASYRFWPLASLELEPARPGLGHPGHAVRLVVVVPLGVAERGAAGDVDDDEDDEHDDVDDGHLAPALLDAGQDAGLARVALEAQRLLVVAPFEAVGVGHHGGDAGVRAPVCLVVVGERA